jgi:lipopolysaccharide export system permease protein
MKTIDGYLLAKTARPLLACIGIALIAMLLERMLELMQLVLNNGGPTLLILKMLANLIPFYLGLAIPAALFIGVMLAVMQLCGNSELDAIYATGMGLRRLVVPVMAMTLLLAIGYAVIVGFLQPYTRYAYRALVYAVTNSVWTSSLESGQFLTGPNNTILAVDGFSPAGRRLSGVFLHQRTPGGDATTTAASAGRLYRSSAGPRLILSLDQGTWIRDGANIQKPTVLTFDRMDVPLDGAGSPAPFRARGARNLELTLAELWRYWNDPPAGIARAAIRAEFHARAVRIVSMLFLPLLAFPLAIGSRRAQRHVSLVAGIALLILYHHALQLGSDLASAGKLPPWLALWLPCAMLAAVSIWAFHTASARPGYNPVTDLLDRITLSYSRLRLGSKAPQLAAALDLE